MCGPHDDATGHTPLKGCSKDMPTDGTAAGRHHAFGSLVPEQSGRGGRLPDQPALECHIGITAFAKLSAQYQSFRLEMGGSSAARPSAL